MQSPEPLHPTSLRTRSTCRLCGCSALVPVLDLGEQCIAGAFATPGGAKPVERAIPLQLVRCDMTQNQDACGLIQTRHTVPGSILYRSYWYRSGVNRTMTENLHEIARQAETLADLQPGDLVVDIGCNDGTLLDGYRTQQLKFLGFDPSDVGRYAVERGYEVVRDFYTAEQLRRRYPDQRAKVITSIAMLYDLEYPQQFVSDIAQVLAETGVWVIELHYLPLMLERNAFDAIVHEHLEYYSLAVLERLFAASGLEVVAAELTDINGGSIRLFASHAARRLPSPQAADALQHLRVREFEMALDSAEPYERFAGNVAQIGRELLQTCQALRKQGRTIHAYGASTKGNTILQYVGLDRSVIDYAADRNPDKWGSETIRTGIPIISEQQSREMHPDYYLVLPWHFLDEFIEREQDFFAKGGRFIVPLPQVSVVDGSGTRHPPAQALSLESAIASQPG